MKVREGIALGFIGGYILAFGGLSCLRMAMTGQGGSFDPYGTDWITIKGLYYGAAGLSFMVGFVTLRGRRWSPAGLLALGIPVLMIWADQWPSETDALVDRAIERIGYRVSRWHPFVPRDVPFPAGVVPPIPPMTEVIARTSRGTIQIAAGRGALRTFTWEGVTRSLQLHDTNWDPPDSDTKRFCTLVENEHDEYGPDLYWEEARGTNGGVESETWESFRTREKAEAWLRNEQSRDTPLVWSSDGLVVGWSTGGNTLTVDVTQILIDGKRPDSLEGAADSAIVVRRL